MEKKPQRQQFNKTKIVTQKASLITLLTSQVSRYFGSLTWFSSAFARYQYWYHCYITFNMQRESIIRVDMRQPCVFTLFYFFDIFFLWKKACLFFSIRFIHVSIAQINFIHDWSPAPARTSSKQPCRVLGFIMSVDCFLRSKAGKNCGPSRGASGVVRLADCND